MSRRAPRWHITLSQIPPYARFDDPEFMALFADILRRMASNKSILGTVRRPGFQKDLKATASLNADEFVRMMAQPSGSAAPPAVQQALRQLMFSTANVALTDGYKMRLRHVGHAMNIVWGPLTRFSTHNFADTYSPLVSLLHDGEGSLREDEEPEMPTLQAMHRKSAASPASTADFWLLRMELAYRHFYGMDKAHIGRRHLHAQPNQFHREDHLASSGTPGLMGITESSLAPGESQGRGFEHCHEKSTSYPKGHLIQRDILQTAAACERAREARGQPRPEECCSAADTAAPALAPAMALYNEQLVEYITTRHYESSVLPGRQLGVTLPAAPFSALQQRQSRYDGQMEPDGVTQRDLVDVVDAEPPAHVAREQRAAAAAERREIRSPYSQVPLTGCSVTLMPSYQLLQNFGTEYPIIDRGELPEEAPRDRAPARRLDDVCDFDDAGAFKGFLRPDGAAATARDVAEDAEQWERAFAHDYRWLSAHSHDHTCATTCVKKMKQATEDTKKKALRRNKAPPCRFWFLHIVSLILASGNGATRKRIRRRGKEIVAKPYVTSTNEHNEYGLVMPERPQPFRAPNSDVICVADRCNVDFRVMERGFSTDDDIEKQVTCDAGSLARCFPDIPYRDIGQSLVRRMAYSVVALHVAAHNCDYYITKYQSKALEQLQNLVTQYATGIRRLEEEEEEARASAAARGEQLKTDPQERARRVLLKLQSAANRCHWFSSTELAVYLRTGGTAWCTHKEKPVFFSKYVFMLHECQRLLEDRTSGLLEAADVQVQDVEFHLRGQLEPEPSAEQHPAPSERSPSSAAPADEQADAETADGASTDEGSAAPPPGRASTRPRDEPHSAEAPDVAPRASQGGGRDDEEAVDASQTDDNHSVIGDPEENFVPVRLHATTSAFDDWLHRGPFLEPLPFFVYMQQVSRVSKAQVAENQTYRFRAAFNFDAHYPMATTYCQYVVPDVFIPRLIGPQCPQHDENDGEDYARWHTALFGVARCPGHDRCCDPLLFKHLLARDAPEKRKHRFAPCWRTHLARCVALSLRARQKLRRARKIPCAPDVSLLKEWYPPEDTTERAAGVATPHARPHALIRLTLMQLLVGRVGHWPAHVFELLCQQLDVAPGFHDEQLHLEEYAALRTVEAVENINMQLLVARKPFRANAQKAEEESEDDSDLLHDGNAGQRETEYIGGEGEDHAITEDEEFAPLPSHRCAVSFELTEVKEMLSRSAEMARATGPGRHKEVEMHMSKYPGVFRHVNDEELVLHGDSSVRPPAALRAAYHEEAMKYQKATAKLLLDAENAMHDVEEEPPAGLDSKTWTAMLAFNDAIDERRCQTVPVQDLSLGPGHVAWKFISGDDVPFNSEQIDCMALLIWDMDKAFREQVAHAESQPILPGAHVLAGGHAQPIRSQFMLPHDLGLPRTLVVGGGGCGKTTMLLKVISPTYEAFFERVARATPSNKSARLFQAKTVHSLNGLTAAHSLRTANIRITNEATRKKTQAIHVNAGALLIDEFSQLQAQLFHANNLFWTVARQSCYGLALEDYARPRETAGRVTKFVLSGDHLQLPPVPMSSSLLAPLEGTSAEQKAGVAMFAGIEQVFLMETMMRFRDPVLRQILEKMRTPGGTGLSGEEWAAIANTAVDVRSLDDANSRRAFLEKINGWIHTSYLWGIVTLAAYTCAKTSAKEAHRTLFYLQAVDTPKVIPRHGLRDEVTGQLPPETTQLYRSMLQVPNLSTTKRLPGFACFHANMRVRITANVLRPWAVQDSTGTVKRIDLHPQDRKRLDSRGQPPAEFNLLYPPILYVQLDDVEHVFLPPMPCDDHAAAGACPECPHCSKLPGLLQISVQEATWFYKDDKIKFSSAVLRQQLPIMPLAACPLYGLQGTTADPGLVAHWNIPKRMDNDLKWLLVYVILSRVRALDCLVSFGLEPAFRKIIEAGPPENFIGAFDRMFQHKIADTRTEAREARRKLGWPMP